MITVVAIGASIDFSTEINDGRRVALSLILIVVVPVVDVGLLIFIVVVGVVGLVDFFGKASSINEITQLEVDVDGRKPNIMVPSIFDMPNIDVFDLVNTLKHKSRTIKGIAFDDQYIVSFSKSIRSAVLY